MSPSRTVFGDTLSTQLLTAVGASSTMKHKLFYLGLLAALLLFGEFEYDNNHALTFLFSHSDSQLSLFPTKTTQTVQA